MTAFLIRRAGIALAAVFAAVVPGTAVSGEILDLRQDDYIGSQICAGCHADAAEAWQASHHALAWTLPGPDTVAGDFSGSSFTHDGMTARFSTRPDGGYSIDVTEKDGTQRVYPVHSVAGVEPLQQYLLETEPGRLQSFDVVWDTEQQRWFHLYPDQDLPPSDGLHWTGPYKTWNARCAECHATGFRKRYDPRSRSYASTQAEMGVGCEACHGPGRNHAKWAGHWQTTQEPPPPGFGFPVDFSDPAQAVEQCATCHSRREAGLDGNPVPGTRFSDAYTLSLLRPGLYHADGQIQDEVYVYGSFLQSRMYAKGVTCLNCHDAHDGELRAEGNGLCTQCHSPAGNSGFPSLRKAEFDSPAHHFHTAGSKAAQCRSCHMAEQVYMGNDWRADHSFRVPRPDLHAASGAPDACTGCHADRTPDWAAGEIAARHPESRHRGAHYGAVLAAGRTDAVAAKGSLEDLALDADQPGIVRATALWLLKQSSSPSAADRIARLLDDGDPLVRAGAAGLQELAAAGVRARRLVPLLGDPVRTVRMAAARAMLADGGLQDAPSGLGPAMADWQAAMATRLDFPETHLQMAGIALTMRDMRSAYSAFSEVVRLDPQRSEAWVMLVRIADAAGGAAAAGEVLSQALEFVPQDAELLALRNSLQGNAAVPAPQDLLPPALD